MDSDELPVSSTGDTGSAPVDSAVSDVTTPVSSSGGEQDTGKTPDTMLDAVKAALVSSKSGDADSPTATQDSDPKVPGQSPAPADEPLPDEVSEEELKNLKPRTAKRIRQLLGRVSERDAEIDRLKPRAEGLDQFVDYLRTSGVSSEDLQAGVEIMSLIRSDPIKALEKLTPTLEYLAQFAGYSLPPDIQKKVEQGFVDEEAARELAMRRNAERLARQNAEQTAARQEAERQEQAFRQHVERARTVGNDWQRETMASDPDWAAKQPRVTELIELAVSRAARAGQSIETAEEIRAVCKAAYEQATKEFRQRAPAPRAIRPPVMGGSASLTAGAEPKSLLDVVKLGSSPASS